MKQALALLLLLALPVALPGADSALNLDPKRIINESSSFLKEREPEMSAEEYALYEKVAAMMATQPEFALRLLQAMVNEKEKPSPAFEFILGNAHYFSGQNEEAEKYYKSASERYPTFLRAWSNLGVLYYSTQKYKEAIPCLAKSVALGDRDPKTFGLLAYCLEQTRNIVQAEMSYMQALSGDPTSGDWMEGLLRIYIQGKQYGRAEWLVKNLIKERPTEVRFWMVHANILLSQNRKLEAMALLETCLGAGIAGSEEMGVLADLYAEHQLIPEATAVYRKLLAANASVGEKRLLNLASVLTASGKIDQAGQVLASISEPLSPEGGLTLLQIRAEWFMAQRKWSDAKNLIEIILQKSPFNGTALLSMGRIQVAEDDLVRALLTYEAAYRLPETTFRASLQLANLEIKNKHYGKAVEYLEKALSIEKIPTVEDYLARIRTLAENSK